jgi:hypothetical protein
MSMAYIRDHYKVPAKRGGRVRYSGNPGGQPPVDGTITASDGAHLRIRLDGNKHSYVFHPTWKLEYLEDDE